MRNVQALTGKRVLITGGSTGIGRETVRLLAGSGARIVTIGRDQAALDDMLESLGDSRTRVYGIAADIAEPGQVDRVFAEMDRRLGGIDVLVACAALGAQPIHEMTDEDWRYVIETNLVGYLACARASLVRMLPAGGGHLLFVGSISSDIKAPGESVYSATKAGVQAFAETLRKEVADRNVEVSVIQPGSVATDMQECSQEEKRTAVAHAEMLHAVEIAEAIEFILTRSERADILNLRIEPRMQRVS